MPLKFYIVNYLDIIKACLQSIKKIPRVTHQNVQFHNRNIPLFDYMKICVYMMKKDKIGVWCVCGMCFFPGTRKRSVHVDFIKKRKKRKNIICGICIIREVLII